MIKHSNFHSFFVLIAVFFCLSLPACSQKSFDEKLQSLYKHSVPLIQPSELAEMKEAQEPVYILDIRSPEEFDVSHLKEAQFIDYDDFNMQNVQEVPKDAKVIVYCSVGYRSERIGEKLKKAGYEDVSNLYGGIFQWKNEGYPVVNQQQQPTDSVHTYNKDWSQWLKSGIKVY